MCRNVIKSFNLGYLVTNIVKIWLSLCLLGCVRFTRHCGKMYSRHLFSYGGLHHVASQRSAEHCSALQLNYCNVVALCLKIFSLVTSLFEKS